ncbi:MAG: DUF58 domain-containing protein [bacterium]|nr:DUF58 domain-containing protein [bacterium]
MTLQETASAFDNIDLLASQVVEGFITGLHRSPFHGFSVEFAEHKIYNKGESTRHIDWKLFGRTDKLFVKRYEEETNLRCDLVLDTSPSMFYPEGSLSKINFGVVAAAVLANLMKKQRDAFGLTLFDEHIQLQTEVRSSGAHYRLILNKLQEVLQMRPSLTKTNVADTLNTIAEQIHRRSLVVVFSDMFDDINENDVLFDALQHLKFRKHEVILFHITDGDSELDFNFENRPYKFVDNESGEELKLFPEDVKVEYLKQMNAYRTALKLKCQQYRIDFAEADTRKDFSQILMPFLVKRQKML